MLLASPISLLLAVFGSSAAPLLFLLIKSQTDTQEDTPTTIKTMAFMTLMGTFPIMFLILESVVKLKEQKIFLVFRRLGMRDSCFWYSVSIQVFLISLISSILGALSWKYFINAVQEIDGRVMLLILFLQNFISGSLMQFWGSFTATSFSSSGIFMMTIMQSLYGFNKAYETVPSGVVILLKQFGFPMTNFGYVWYAILEKTAQFQDGALVDVKNSFGFSELQDTLANGLAPSLLLTITFEMAIFYMLLSLYLSLTVEYQGFSITSNMFFSSKYWNPEVQGISSNTIETNQVTKRYLHNFTAVKSMTQRFEKGNIYGIVGKNGAGKSTRIL
jgi:ABC-type multidrug transport system fused ATPase/permease subunit